MKAPRETYTELERRHTAARDRARQTALAISSLRGLAFVGAVAALVLHDTLAGLPARVALGATWILIVGFVALIVRHRRVRAGERRHDVLRSLAAEGILRLDGRWDALEAALPEVEARPFEVAPDHAYARDLDVLGTASLTRLAGPVSSAPGRRTLREWLLAPSSSEVVRERQAAVRNLAPAVEFREELAARGRLAPPAEEDALAALLEWAEAQPSLLARRWPLLASWALPPIVLALVVFWVFRGTAPWWVFPLGVQLWVLARARKVLEKDFSIVEEGAPALQAASPQIQLMEEATWEAPLLLEMTARLATHGRPAHRVVAGLARTADVVQSRRNLVYGVLDIGLLLDLHVGYALDRWRARWGRDVRGWLETAGRMEALSALATMTHDHPDWTMPRWGDAAAPDGDAVLRARGLGHPLLPPATCVRNDVQVGPAGTFLFVTGSNMSGKSTLLRAIGANAVLAGAGAPVCATELSLPEVRIWTSMRVDDSVVDGVSRFMAELLRVRAIVDAARARAAGEPPVLYLLDEMLQGTNTAERRVAARAVLRHLITEEAVGAVTSHDLTLADEPDLLARREAFHFREHVEPGEHGASLSFDYVLRPGLATTRNALRLLEAVGLGSGEGDPGDLAPSTTTDLEEGSKR